ncbi:protein of unknown function [Cyclobacterium lianum]|uniref:3-keto-alpha-glucoside-1,2-lyase/3-keto-2-hydroxy-glucal hydratase domain-containing protein n=1 Tax=Cyclobacterium lianum TaxID=388280 RepID=A0A1M7KDP2_9BACT|nr:DUF1080 domain-containing protein [Cyclobacterium lianum]SHM62953.1 protein of unknown function [Cyclobacterium lianum]
MKKIITVALCALMSFSVAAQKADKDGWIKLFNGKSFKGWTISENPESFSIEDGVIKIDGPRAHMFYTGKVEDHDFRNFELKMQIKTMPSANSGVFIHTDFQEDGWPAKGYEIQVNQSHGDWRKTGSVYSFKDVRDTYVSDGEWYTKHIIVDGENVTVKVNGEVVNEFTESRDREAIGDSPKKLSSGTIALQAHDPNSVIYYKDIMIKPLP